MVMTAEGAGAFRIETTGTARLLFLAGPVVNEAVLQHGPFIMRETAEINAAIERYQQGKMGRLAPHPRRRLTPEAVEENSRPQKGQPLF